MLTIIRTKRCDIIIRLTDFLWINQTFKRKSYRENCRYSIHYVENQTYCHRGLLRLNVEIERKKDVAGIRLNGKYVHESPLASWKIDLTITCKNYSIVVIYLRFRNIITIEHPRRFVKLNLLISINIIRFDDEYPESE